jgi:hypothetical protein
MAINLNQQVNIWRGQEDPPTVYHLWIYNDNELRLYDGTTWQVFIDSSQTISTINSILARITSLEGYTINNKKITTNPVLSGSDINVSVTDEETIDQSISKTKALLTTQIISE